MQMNELTGAIIAAAMKVHSALGPGLLESVYERCLIHELNKIGLRTASQIHLPVAYDGLVLDGGYKLDVLVEDIVIVELKAAEMLTPLHSAQLLSYLKLSGKPVGLLINFNSIHLRSGIRRLVNGPIAKGKYPFTSAASSASSVTNSGGS
jgi:GxxExxY protein